MWGIISERHFMKVNPFMVRLQAATGALNNAVDQYNVDEIARGLEDVGFWTARTVSEMISGSDEADTPAHIKLFKRGVSSLFQAQAANVRARKALRKMLTSTTYTAPSSIPSAGEGAFASKPFRPGEMIGTIREKSSSSYGGLEEWTPTPLVQHINHSPTPNMQVVATNHGPHPALVIVALCPIGTDEELTMDYQDPGLPENAENSMEIPPEWNKNALLAKKTTDLTQSTRMSLGLVVGPLMVLGASKAPAPWNTALTVSGGAISAWALFQWLQTRD